jgi:putative hydrolase
VAAFNEKVARMFRECADILRAQDANPFRVNAYVHAAETLEFRTGDIRELLKEKGIPGLVALPAIGQSLAAAIDEIARTGRFAQLDRLRGEATPEVLFQSVPGIGPKLAHMLHEELHVDTLEALEVAAHDGRLAKVRGVGPRRAAVIQASLAEALRRGAVRTHEPLTNPSVETLLDVDGEYRRRAKSSNLQKIAPKRFNPEGKAWLPILHTTRDDWHFTALFSNTARAHKLGRTDDWVVLYYYDDEHREGQCTIVTETHGAMEGKRVVRGREAETRRAQRQKSASRASSASSSETF